MEIFLANLRIKLDRGLIVLPAKPPSQPYKCSNKIQCRYELQISAKIKSNKIVICQLLSNSQPVDQYSISRIVWNVIEFLSVTARITKSQFFPCTLQQPRNRFENLWLLEMCQHEFLRIFTNFKNVVKFANFYEF